MSFQRSNFPVRLQQILSGGRAVIPSLKLETEPPPNVKAFIDRVIKSPLHEIDKLLSGFQWKYNKGNYHHWRALFLHFDAYFKTYLSCRKDLLLADNMLDEDIFPKHSVLQILRVMQIILTNCHNKSSFDGLEHFKLLLSSTDPDILIATLETLSGLVRINPSKLHGSGGKPIGCGSINSHLMSLAQGWGSKEEGLGLFSCVVANERSQREGCSYPLDIDDNCKSNQYRLGSTLHFEFRSVIPLCDEKPNQKGQASTMSVIHIPDLHLKKEDDLTILKQCVEQYGVPLEHRFSLLTRIRYAHAFRSSQICSLYSRICILAFMVLVQSNDAHDELVSFFANEPEYTNELIRLVRSDDSISDNVKALAMFALGAELAAYTSSHERARILSGSTVISAGGNRMVLLTVLQKAILSLNSETDPSSVLFVEALLQFFLLHVLSSSSSGSAVRGSGMIPPLLPLLQNMHPAHMHLVSSAVKALQKLMEYSNPAVSLLKDLGGVELLVKRLQIEVHIVIDTEGESSSSVVPINQYKFDVDHLHDHKRFIKALLKALGSTTYSPASSTRSQDSSDNSLPDSLSLIFRNASRFGSDIYFAAVTVMSEIIHKDPTCFPILYELGLPNAFLSSVVSGVLPSSKALICIPGALGAICLNAKGLEAVKETACLQFLVDAFTTKKYLVAMNEGVVLLANAVEELLRHASSLRPMGVDVILQIISKLAPADDGKGSESVGSVDEDTAMEMDVEDKDNRVDAMESDGDNITSEQFVRLCIFHVMVLVHRTVENTETCRLFVEKKGIETLMRLLLQPCIAQSSEGMPVALHSTVVFKGFTQHHSTPLAVAFCAALRDHLNKALNGLQSASGIFLLNPRTTYDSSLFSPLFVIEFLLFLGACKDHRWVATLLTEFGNGSRDVFENVGQIHREVLWQLALLEDSKLEKEVDTSGSEAQSSDPADDSEEQGLNSIQQYIDPLLRRRVSGWSVESQFLDLISMYRDIGRAARSSRRMDINVAAGTRLLPSSRGEASTSPSVGSVSRKETDKLKSYNSSCRDMMRSLSYHISHLFMELGKAMILSSRRGSDSLNISPTIKSVASTFTSTVLNHLNFRVSVGGSSPNEVSISTKCRYLGKVIDFIDSILLEKPDSYNPILMNCFYGRGVVEVILTTFEATSQLLFAVNKTPASPMETDNESSKQELKKETDNSWIYGPLASYGTLMDHLVTSSFIINSHLKQLLDQPLFNENGPFPRDPEAFVKILQSKVVRAVLSIWNHCNFTECNNEFVTAVISIMRHVYSGVEVRNISSSNGGRASGAPPDESTISLITDMGFSRSRAEEALRQVDANSVELATDWLFSHPEEPEEDDELAHALKLSLGNSGTSSNEALSSIGDTEQEIETAQLPPVDELLPACIRLLQANESLAFPIKDLLLTISLQNDGESRQNVLNLLIDRLRGSVVPDASNKILLSALLHVLALILNEDTTACEVAYRSGLVNIALDHLSQWDPASCDVDKVNVPKWVTASFLSIDLMLQLESKLSSGGLDPEKIKTDAFNHQTSVVTGENKCNGLQFSSGTTSVIEIDDKKRLMEIACKCIKYQLPSDTMHVVLQLCATLTKVHSVAVIFLDLGGLPALLFLPTRSLFSGFDNVAAAIIRHILEDPHTLQQAMESEIRHSLAALSSRHSNGRVTPRNFVQSLSSIISRDPVVFMRAAQSICQIEMTGERPYIVLLKDREKEKMKDRDKEKTMEKEKQLTIDSNIKNTKVHRKSPQSFTSAIELLLDSITMFVPSDKVADAVDGFLGPPIADMDIDSAAAKGKGKAADVAPEASKITNQEASASLAKSVFILKLLTEIIWTYPSSINVLLRKDAEVSSFAISQRGNSTHSGGGVFHHILHKFLPCSGTLRRDKKTDTDWRQKLTSRAKQVLVASSARSAEGRKRILIEANNIFLEFINSSDGCITPDTNMHSFLDLLNDMLAARTPTGSLISTEASVTFIDVGLVQSLTRILQMLDLDHADSPKLITGIIKALELVTKEHVHSAEPNSTKGDLSVKASSDHNEQERIINNGNTFQSLETSSQPDRNAMATDRVESLNANQTAGSSDSVADDMDHERDLDGGFVPEADDYFMHETSEAGGSADNNGIANVEIRFDIPRNVNNLDDEDDEMSGDEEEVDEDDDEDDDENNELEEDDAHHMSHPETDQDEHDIDEEEFDEDVLEEEDDEDDEDGVILRLEEGINGINVFEQLDLLEQGAGNFPNETLRVMPLEVFESRRQDRNASIYNLMGRTGRRGSSEHPLLTDPSLRNLPQQRQSDNTIDAAFSDRSLESAPSRLDAVFRSLRSGRHSHRFNMWIDDTRQRGGSNANTVPQGIEELLVSQLRRPTPEHTPEQVGSAGRVQEEDESNRQGECGIHLEPTRAEDFPTDGNLIISAPSSVIGGGETTEAGLADGHQLQGQDVPSSSEQVIDMQYERSDATGRDVEAVSLESGGSSATLGESLRSLDVEIGSADGHDDGGERQGDIHQVSRARRPAESTLPLGSRDMSLESVSEIPLPHPGGDVGQGSTMEEHQLSRNAEAGSIDPTFLDALPEELRAEVLSSAQQNQVPQSSTDQPPSTGEIDPEFLAALPPDIRAEVLAQQQAQRVHQSQELEGQPVEMDTVSIIATFPSDLREEVLLTSPDNVLASLTPALVAEANMLRERFAHRYHSGTLFGMYPRNRRGESSRRVDPGSALERAGAAARRPLGTKMIEADGAPLVDTDALKAMVRLLRVVQPLYKGQLQRLLLNLCAHHETRSSLVRLFMDMLMLDVCDRGDSKSINTAAEPLYRLYACQSHIIYSRPQFSDGVPPLVSRRILETLTYLAKNHPNVARLLLHLELPRPHVNTVEHGRGKAIMTMDEVNSDRGMVDFSIVLLLSLLNQPLYLRSVAHLEQLLNLLEVVIADAQNDLSISNKITLTSEKNPGSENTLPDAPVHIDLSGSSAGRDVKQLVDATHFPTVTGVSNASDTRVLLLNLPQMDLRQLCSLLAREGLSDSAYSLVAEVLKKLVTIVPDHCHLFVTELASSVQTLSTFAMSELHMYEDTDKMPPSSSGDGTAILRVLLALSSLVITLRENEKVIQLHIEKDQKDALSQVWSLNAALEPLWSELSNCISRIESASESTTDVPTNASLSITGVAPPLPVGTQNILPYIESFFVVCEKLYPGQSGIVQELCSATATDVEDATTSVSAHKSGTVGKMEEKNAAFVRFSEKHRKTLNAFVRQNPGLLEKSFSLMLKVPRFIDFDNKRAHFRSKIKHQHDHHHSSLRISVRRAYILEDSYNQLRMRSPQDLKGRLTVHFQGEEGIDAGGLTREWYQLLSRVVFDKGALLFTTVGNESTFQPNPNSVYQTEHLSYFKFVGRVVGKALFDGQLLDAHFTRSFYKHILGVKVTYHDIEAIDPDYFKNLKWMLENDISDELGLTFSIDADEEKLILYERAEVTDYELIPGGRNIRVTEDNKQEYVDLVAEHRLTTAIRPQINAFMEGFNDLIPKDLISIFNDKELELLISGLPDIDLDDLRMNTEYSGYSNASPVIQWFWEVVQGLSKEDKARLLQFVTGTSKVPLDGFNALQGISGSQRFQIHKAYGSANHLPSAHTCFNQLDLPEYPTKEQLQERLLLAIHEGSEGFGFG